MLKYCLTFTVLFHLLFYASCLHCFDTVGRKGIRPVKNGMVEVGTG